jgi:two-component system response regulator FlrC
VKFKQLPRVLLVEDEKSIRDIIVPLLFSGGFDCREAETGQSAIDLLGSGVRINLVLSNLLLPEVDGFTLLLHVKQNYPKIPFLPGEVYLLGTPVPVFAHSGIRSGIKG